MCDVVVTSVAYSRRLQHEPESFVLGADAFSIPFPSMFTVLVFCVCTSALVVAVRYYTHLLDFVKGGCKQVHQHAGFLRRYSEHPYHARQYQESEQGGAGAPFFDRTCLLFLCRGGSSYVCHRRTSHVPRVLRSPRPPLTPLFRIVQLCGPGGVGDGEPDWLYRLQSTGWLKHIENVLVSSRRVAELLRRCVDAWISMGYASVLPCSMCAFTK